MLGRLSMALNAGWQMWKNGPVPGEWDETQWRYLERWMLYSGELLETALRASGHATDPSIYRNAKLLWKHHEAMVDFYAGVIYQGSLATDGRELPEGVPNAIPFDPQTGNDDRNALLLSAIAELESAWNWQQQMSLRPMYGAALGDCLTELADDTDRRFVYPEIVWPGYVKHIELDYVGNVQAYTLEYQVRTDDGSHLYRKEADKTSFRHYRNDKLTEEIPNPYGFVPAVWDRHRIGAPGMVRGKAAADGTRQALLRLNSLFSHSFDFQHKAFWVPFMVSGQNGVGNSKVDLGAPPSTGSYAEMMRWIKVAEGSSLLQPQFDIGKTLEIIKDIREGILAENPEASFYQQMREMTQVTAPGAERLMGDVKNRVDLARAGYDANTVKLFQMAIAMAGFRANDRTETGWLRPGQRLDRRRLAFTSFDLQSFSRGELDMSIMSRPLVIPTESERISIEQQKVALIASRETLQTVWAMEQAGVEDGQTVINQREDAMARTANLADGLGPIGE